MYRVYSDNIIAAFIQKAFHDYQGPYLININVVNTDWDDMFLNDFHRHLNPVKNDFEHPNVHFVYNIKWTFPFYGMTTNYSI